MVLDIDEERRRISLGIKQCKVNPWDDFANPSSTKATKSTGKIKSITKLDGKYVPHFKSGKELRERVDASIA